ncbi:MAG: TIGR02996 domain-containing protein [Deltaproteobacteria bacterium]|nr:TIGR02996 domain-containing protein [Deltaproteobacteria bacterium]
MGALADLEAELARGGGADPVRALPLAIAAWREVRADELANLVDALAARYPSPPPPRLRVHAWWVEHARTYDPGSVATLARTLWVRHDASDVTWATVRERWPRTPNPVVDVVGPPPDRIRYTVTEAPNWVDRLALLFAWPDDPRLGPMLTDFLLHADLRVLPHHERPLTELIAARLVALGDRRVVPRLTAYLRELPVASRVREQHRSVADRVVAELGGPARMSSDDAAVIARSLAAAPATARRADLDALWREIEDHPDDVAPRLVLADALTELGDPRGELIVLQCRPPPDGEPRPRQATRIQHLLRTEWDRWFGDLALVLTRTRSELRRGMLEVACIGQHATPPWAWDKIRGHRELATVHTVRAGHVAPAQFAAFVDGLPRFPRELEIDAPEVIDELARRRPRLPLERVAFAMTSSTTPHRRTWPPFVATFEHLAQLAPDLVGIELGAMWSARFGAQVVDLVPHLARMFPRLAQIRVSAKTLANLPDPGAIERLAALPLVELYDREGRLS